MTKKYRNFICLWFFIAMPSITTAEVIDALGCMLEPSKEVDVSSPVSGVADEVMVRRGDVIEEGDVLLRLKTGIQVASLKMAEAKKEFAQRNIDRNRELIEEQLLSPHEKDEMETELLMADMELRLKSEELAMRTIYSPVSGVVVDRFRDAGEYVSNEPVFSLATLDPLHIDLLLPSRYFGTIEQGQALLVKPELNQFKPQQAKVTIVDPIIDPASGTFRVQLSMSNKGNVIPAGMRCTIEKQAMKNTSQAAE